MFFRSVEVQFADFDLDFEVCCLRRMTEAGVQLSVSESDEGSQELRAPLRFCQIRIIVMKMRRNLVLTCQIWRHPGRSDSGVEHGEITEKTI